MANYLTQDDVNNYGTDLLDVSQRAALHAVSPHLQTLEQQNTELRQRLAQEQRHRLDQEVEHAIPNYREIDRDPEWHRWLLSVDPFTGRIRQHLLSDAIASGSAPRVIAFFRGFQQAHPAASQDPGRARTTSASSERRTYTREEIGRLYELHRKGAYAGREAEWNRLEADFFRAQREGRISGPPYLTK